MKHPRSLAYLRAFEAMARLGSVRAAALELNLTAGAVSQQLHNLRDALGVDLFRREGRRLRLTDAGQALRRSVGNALAEIGACVDEIATRRDAWEATTLTVSVPPTLGMSWLTPLMFAFIGEVGLASFRMLPAVEMGQVDWRASDVAIVYGNPPWKGYWWRPMANVTLRPVCSPRLLYGPAPLRSVGDVADHCLLHEDDGSEWRRWLQAADVERPAGRNAYFGALVMALTAALEGNGLALVSDFLVQDYLRSGRLVRPFETAVAASHNYYCVCAEARSQDPLVSRFIDWIVAKAQAAPP